MGDNLEDDLLDDESDEKNKGKLPVLVVYDDCKEAFWTLLVSQKGPTESVVKWSFGRLEDSGYIGESIRVKSDQEESIVALRKARRRELVTRYLLTRLSGAPNLMVRCSAPSDRFRDNFEY